MGINDPFVGSMPENNENMHTKNGGSFEPPFSPYLPVMY